MRIAALYILFNESHWSSGLDCLVVEEGGGLHYSSEELTELSQLEEVVVLLTKLKLVDQARVGVLVMGREVGVGGSHLSLLLENTRKVYLGAVRALFLRRSQITHCSDIPGDLITSSYNQYVFITQINSLARTLKISFVNDKNTINFYSFLLLSSLS